MKMTLDKAIEMLIAKNQCIERETSGINSNCNHSYCDNCDLCYEQGTMGEQKEVLKYAVEIMRKYQKIEHIVKAEIPYKLVEIEKVVEDENKQI